MTLDSLDSDDDINNLPDQLFSRKILNEFFSEKQLDFFVNKCFSVVQMYMYGGAKVPIDNFVVTVFVDSSNELKIYLGFLDNTSGEEFRKLADKFIDACGYGVPICSAIVLHRHSGILLAARDLAKRERLLFANLQKNEDDEYFVSSRSVDECKIVPRQMRAEADKVFEGYLVFLDTVASKILDFIVSQAQKGLSEDD